MNKEIFSEILLNAGINLGIYEIPHSNIDKSEGNKSRIWYFGNEREPKWVIKQYPQWIQHSDLAWIHNYMTKLSQNKFPVVEVVGEPVQYDDNLYAIYSYAGGKRYDFSNRLNFIDMASKLGELHFLGQNLIIDGYRNWPVVAGFKYEGDNEFLSKTWNLASELLEETNGDIIPIHGDFRRENIRFDSRGVSKVFDFGNARNDYPEADLAVALKDIGKDKRLGNYINTWNDFLRIYRESNNGITRINPNLLSASTIVLSIQEYSYLLSESHKGNIGNIEEMLTAEFRQINFLIDNLSIHQKLYKEVFK